MIYVGIDNGLNGGIVAIDDNQDVIFNQIMPVIKGSKTEYNEIGLSFMLEDLKKKDSVRVVLEKAHVRPVSGKRACFMNGVGYGIMRGVLASLRISYQIVSPKEWQKDVLKDTGNDTKLASIQYCLKRYPNQHWPATLKSSKSHDGKTDACCMAVYCYRLYNRGDVK